MQQLLQEISPKNVNHKKAFKDFLTGVPLFAEFTDDGIADLLKNAHIKTHKKGKLLFLIEDKAENFYIVVDGWVKLFRETRDGHESLLALITSGESLGKAAALTNTTYSYNAEVTDDATLISIPASFLISMTKDNKKFDEILKKLLQARLSDLNQLSLYSEHLALMTSAQRVGCFLLKLCREPDKDSAILHLPYEKGLVAVRLGMTPETFSRSLNQLASIGVETNNSKITIQNISQLRSLVCERCSATGNECHIAKWL